MSDKTSPARQREKLNRAERLLATIASLEAQIEKISASGEVAPPGCCLARPLRTRSVQALLVL